MHMALPFVMAHIGVTSAIIAPRKMEHLDDLLAASEVILDDQVLDQIDEIVAPGTDVGPLDASYNPPAIYAVEPASPTNRRAHCLLYAS